MTQTFLIVLASTLFSGFFALTGFALRTFRRSQLEELLDQAKAKFTLEQLDRNLSALTLSSGLYRGLANIILFAGMFYLFEISTGKGGVLTLVLAMLCTLVILAVFSVGIPHIWASYAAEKIVVYTYPVLKFSHVLLCPAVKVMMWLDVPIKRLLGVSESQEESIESAKQEILQAASEGQAEGAVDAQELEMIESIMEFADTQAGEIITPRTDIFALPIDTPWKDAIRNIVEAGHTRVPVYLNDIDNIIGVLYAKDMLGLIGSQQEGDLRKLLRKPFFVPESKPLNDLLKEFKLRKVHLAIVLDEYGGTAGIVTIEDVIEEIVGDISDEYDRAEPALMHRIDEKTAEVDGRMYIDDLNDAMDLELPEDEDYDTVAGLVFGHIGYIPTVNETFVAHGVEFTILGADERKITRLKVRVIDKDKAQNREN